MIKIANTYINPQKLICIRVPNMMCEGAMHRVEMHLEGIPYGVVLADNLTREEAHLRCKEFSALVELQSYGVDEGEPHDNAADPQA